MKGPDCPRCTSDDTEPLRGGWVFCNCCGQTFKMTGGPLGK